MELLGLTIDKELNFSKHIDKLCRNAQYKLHALRRIRKYLSLEKAKMLGNTFIDSQFNVQLCTINMDVLQKGILFEHAEGSS